MSIRSNLIDSFFDNFAPSLELGRSFVSPDYQKTHYSLHLLWRGIGAYTKLHSKYRRLYGTVSLSRMYDLRSICAMCDGLIVPTPMVQPRHPLDTDLGPEWQEFKAERAEADGRVPLADVSNVVKGMEGGMDLPILLRHYHKVGAQFHAVGVDINFNHTPGLLLSVDLEQVPERQKKTYL